MPTYTSVPTMLRTRWWRTAFARSAKSMLDEVLAEGNDSQQEEARRLLAEIR
jgi:hypothetical protein